MREGKTLPCGALDWTTATRGGHKGPGAGRLLNKGGLLVVPETTAGMPPRSRASFRSVNRNLCSGPLAWYLVGRGEPEQRLMITARLALEAEPRGVCHAGVPSITPRPGLPPALFAPRARICRDGAGLLDYLKLPLKLLHWAARQKAWLKPLPPEGALWALA